MVTYMSNLGLTCISDILQLHEHPTLPATFTFVCTVICCKMSMLLACPNHKNETLKDLDGFSCRFSSLFAFLVFTKNSCSLSES